MRSHSERTEPSHERSDMPGLQRQVHHLVVGRRHGEVVEPGDRRVHPELAGAGERRSRRSCVAHQHAPEQARVCGRLAQRRRRDQAHFARLRLAANASSTQ